MIPQIQPIVDAMAAGIPVGKLTIGKPCPKLPVTPMMILVDDVKGNGPSGFDSTALFDQIDSVVIAVPLAFADGAKAVAARARAGGRALLVQTPTATLALWLALISERRNLARDFALLGTDQEQLPADAALMLKDIGALAAGTLN